jgi:hypothetical protein
MDTVDIKIKLSDAAKFAADCEVDAKAIDSVGNAADRTNKKSRKAADGMNVLQKAIKPAKWIALAGVITQASSLGVGSVFALVAALTPLVGLLGAVPAGLLGVAQGFGVLKLSMMGVGGAVGGLNAQMDPKKFAALSDPAQRFALTLNSLKAPILALQRKLQDGLFPGLTAGLKAAKPAISALTGPLTGTARVFGQFGDKLGHLVGSKGFLADLTSQARFNNVQLGRLGGAGLHVVDAFRQLMVASRPLVSSLVHMVDGWAKNADAMATAGRKSGSLQAFFKRTATVIREVVKIGGNLAGTLIHIGGIADKQVGQSMLQSLVKGTGALDKWSASAAGTKKIAGYFASIKSTLHDVLPAIKQVGGLFTTLGSSGGLSVLALEAQSLGDIAASIAWIAKVVPGGTPAIVAFATGFYLFQKLKIIAIFGGLKKGIEAVGPALSKINGLCILTRIQLAGLWVAEKVAGAFALLKTALTGGMISAFWALDGAMDANPVGLIVIGVVALAGAFYLAYTKIRWFHNAVNDTFSFIAKHWPLLLAILTGPIGLATLEIVKHWDTIKKGASDVLRFLGGIATGIANLIIGAINIAAKAINVLIGGYNAVQKALPFGLGAAQVAPLAMTPTLGGAPAAALKGTQIPGMNLATKPRIISGRVSGSVLAPSHGVSANVAAPVLVAPTHAKVTRGDDSGAPAHTAAVQHIHVHVKSELKLDGQKVAENTGEAVAKSQAFR